MTFTPEIGDGAQLMDLMQTMSALNGFSLVDPSADCEVTPGADAMTIDVSSGDARLGGPAEEVVGATGVSLPAADASQPRKALVYIDGDGSAQVLGGDPDDPFPDGWQRTKTAMPAVPVPSEPFLPIAEVWIPAGATDISGGDIIDRRTDFNQGGGSGLNAGLLRGKSPQDLYPPVYGSGEDGVVQITSDTTLGKTVYHATEFIVDEGVTATCDPAEPIIVVRATERIEIHGTLWAIGDNGGTGGQSHDAGGESGGGGLYWPDDGGGGGSSGKGGSGGSGGEAYLDQPYPVWHEVSATSDFRTLFEEMTTAGSGGGGGGASDGGFASDGDGVDGGPPGGAGEGGAYDASAVDDRLGVGGDGGAGGGVVCLIAPEIVVTGHVSADAEDGEDGSEPEFSSGGGGGGGGGGSGGIAAIYGATTDTSDGQVTADRGEGGSGAFSSSGGDGGDGAPGADGLVILTE